MRLTLQVILFLSISLIFPTSIEKFSITNKVPNKVFISFNYDANLISRILLNDKLSNSKYPNLSRTSAYYIRFYDKSNSSKNLSLYNGSIFYMLFSDK